jgi:serine/threonine protein kinase
MAEAAQPSAAEPDRRAHFDFSEEEDVDDEIPAGTIVVDRYRVISALGAGGMGTVYLAEHLTIGRRVAIKVLNGEWSGHKFVARRFQAEARIASTIGHPNIVEVFDAGQLPDQRLFLVMEHLDGHDLAQEIVDRGTLSQLRTAEILRQVALALAAAHNVGVIHRDLKPGNIMIANGAGGEVVKILDFGIACSPRATAREGQRLTLPGSVMGTPEYMAPEQSTSAEPTPRFDLYALGAIAYEMLTGDPPILAEHAYELLVRKRKEPSPSLGVRAPHLHPDLVALIDDCLEILPSRRPLDAIEFIHRLDAFIDELPDDNIPDDPMIDTSSVQVGTAAAAAAGSPAIVTGPRAAISRPPAANPTAPMRLPVPRITPPAAARRAWIPLAISAVVIAIGAWLLMSIFDLSSQRPLAEAVPADSSADSGGPGGPIPPGRPLGLVERPLSPLKPPPLTPDPPIVDPGDPNPKISTPVVGTPRPPAGKRENNSPECQRIRDRADEARRAQSWGRLRDLSKRRTCWPTDAEARKLQTKALMELGDFTGCMSAGQGLSDKEVVQWRKLCERRAG